MDYIAIYFIIASIFGFFNANKTVNEYKSLHFHLRPPYPSFQHRTMAAIQLGGIFLIAYFITGLLFPLFILDLIFNKKKGRKL
jgi:hypothetical protein